MHALTKIIHVAGLTTLLAAAAAGADRQEMTRFERALKNESISQGTAQTIDPEDGGGRMYSAKLEGIVSAGRRYDAAIVYWDTPDRSLDLLFVTLARSTKQGVETTMLIDGWAGKPLDGDVDAAKCKTYGVWGLFKEYMGIVWDRVTGKEIPTMLAEAKRAQPRDQALYDAAIRHGLARGFDRK